MENMDVDFNDESSTGDQKQTNFREFHHLAIQHCVQSLVHAYQCHDANCRLPRCQKMKCIVQHAKSCKRKTNGGCPICKQLIALLCRHANHCQEAMCPVPLCLNIKHRLRQRHLQQRLQQAHILVRRIAILQEAMYPVPLCLNIKHRLRQRHLQQRLQQARILMRRIAILQNMGLSGSMPQPSPGNSNSSSQSSPGAPPHTSPHPPQPGVQMKPSSGPPVDALQAVHQVEAAAAIATRQLAPQIAPKSTVFSITSDTEVCGITSAEAESATHTKI